MATGSPCGMQGRRVEYADYRDRLQQNHDLLARDLEVDEVVDLLYARGVFTLDEMDTIRAPDTRLKRTTRLLAQLPGKGPAAFGHFLDALEEPFPDLREMLLCDLIVSQEDQQKYISRILTTGQVPARPEYFADRPEEVLKVRDALAVLKDEDGFVVLYGMGGSGKSMLASEVLRDHNLLLDYFPDGVFWLTIGQIRTEDGQVDSAKLLMKMQNLCARLEREPAERPPNIEAAHDRLFKIFSESYGRALLILDDVWSQVVARAFAVRCRCLVTTRFAGVANQTRAPHVVEIQLKSGFTLDQTLTVFSYLTQIPEQQLPPEAKEMHEQCQGLPLAVAMLGALLKPDPKQLRWHYYLKHLRDKKISRIRSTSSDTSNFDSLSASMAVSVDALADIDRELYEYYTMFAIFDDDPLISSQVLAVLWGMRDPVEVEVKMDRVLEMSLARKLPATQVQLKLKSRGSIPPHYRHSPSSGANSQGDSQSSDKLLTPAARSYLVAASTRDNLGRERSLSITQLDFAHYSVHDLQLDYLKEQLVSDEQRQEYHKRLVEGYSRKCGDRFHELPDDGYVHRYLAFHLMEADMGSRLCSLLVDLRWIEAKLLHCGADDLLNDFMRFIEHEKRCKLAAEVPVVQPRRRPGRRATKQNLSRPTSVDPKIVEEVQVYQRFISIHAHRLLEDKNVSVIQLGLSQPQSSIVYQQALQVAQREAKHGAFYVRLSNASEDVESHHLTVRLHQQAVLDVKCSPDTMLAASCSTDLSVRLWNRVTGAMVATMEGHENYVTACCFNPVDTSEIVSASEDGTVRVWCIDSGRDSSATQLREHRDDDSYYTCADVSPDGEWCAVGDLEGCLKVLFLATCRVEHSVEGHDGQIYGCAYSSNGKYIATASADATAKIWLAADLSEVATFTNHKLLVYGCAFARHCDRLVTCSGDYTLKVWPVAQGSGDEELATMSLEGVAVMTCTFSPDDKFIVSGAISGMVHVWDGSSYEHLYSLVAHNSWVHSLSFEPHGKKFITCSDDCTCKVWELSETAHRDMVQYDRRLDLFVDEDSAALTLTCLNKGTNELTISRGFSMDVVGRHSFGGEAVIKSFALASDLGTVAYASTTGRVRIAETSAGVRNVESTVADADHIVAPASEGAVTTPESALLVDDTSIHHDEVKIVQFSPDNRFMATASTDGIQAVWSVDGGNTRLLFSLTDSMASRHVPFVFFRTRPWLLTTDTSGMMKVYNLEGGSEIVAWQSGEEGQPLSMAMADDDKYVLVAVNKVLRIWLTTDLTSKKKLATVGELEGHKDVIRSCTISPDGKRIATGSDDRNVALWETERFYQVNKMKVRFSLSWIVDIEFSSDSEILVAVSDRIKFWSAANGDPLRTVHLAGAFTKYIRTDPLFSTFATIDDKGVPYLLEAVFADDAAEVDMEP
ncbi:apoptotic protease-activating factor 1-like [Sycon ciliatum]|uniref:apoptotic protease-activating factor 1-like n=1 Tax=Sycon ciliatum TaxID=27933 RepID=UPI0031F7008C